MAPRKALGWILIAIGILLNEWILGALLTSDGRIDGIDFRVVIGLFNVVAVALGIVRIRSANRLSNLHASGAPLPVWVRRLLAGCVSILILITVLELSSRLYWMLTRGVPVPNPECLVYGFYPELKSVDWFLPREDDGTFDILLLGGSVLTNAWGSIERILLERATYDTRKPVRIHNLAVPGHSSRDSLVKYRYLREVPFDLVVFYHAINETRANNCPPAIFATDYSQYAWYDAIAKLDRHKESRYLLFPFTADFLMTALRQRFGSEKQPRMAQPRVDWLRYGAEIKTERTFRANLEEIVSIAEDKNEPVLLMSYATYIPDGYTEEAFAAKQLDYTLHKANIALWGELPNVTAGVAAHNAVTKEIASRYEHVRFIDQDGLIPKDGRYFNDVCHFTNIGCEAFVDNILPDVLNLVASWSAGVR